MRATTRYMLCIVATKGGGITHTEGAISIRHAVDLITRRREENPTAHMIFIRRYQQRNGKETYVVLHDYTVFEGRTASERRTEAVQGLTV